MESSDKSKQVDWYVRKNTDVSITITFTASGVYNTSVLTLACGVYRGTNLVFSPTIVNGGVTGIVTLSATNTQTGIVEDEYFWRLSTSAPLDMVILQGTFKINDYLWDGGENASGAVIVDINGTNVTLTIAIA